MKSNSQVSPAGRLFRTRRHDDSRQAPIGDAAGVSPLPTHTTAFDSSFCRSLTARADRLACTQIPARVPARIALAPQDRLQDRPRGAAPKGRAARGPSRPFRHVSPARSIRQPVYRSPAPFLADRNSSALRGFDRKTQRRRCRLMRLAASPIGVCPRKDGSDEARLIQARLAPTEVVALAA